MMNVRSYDHRLRHQHLRVYDEPPLLPSSQSSDQSSTTDGLYASIRPSNITTVDFESFSAPSEDGSIHDDKIKLGRRWRCYFKVIFAMVCLQMIAIVVLGAAIHFHQHDGGKPTRDTAVLLSQPIAMAQSDVSEDGHVGPASLCVPGLDIKYHSENCTILKILHRLLEKVDKNLHAAMSDMNKTANNVMTGLNRNMSKLAKNSRLQDSSLYNITDTVASLNRIMNGLQAKVTDLSYQSTKADNRLTLARLRGRRDNNIITWDNGRDKILRGDVQYDNSEKCLRVGREGHCLLYSQLCVSVPSTSSAVHFTQAIQRKFEHGTVWHSVLYKELSVQRGRIDCTYVSGIVHLGKKDCVKVVFSDEELISSNQEHNSFGLYMLA